MPASSPAPLASAAEAFAAIALAAVACDGELAQLELRSLRQQLEFRQPYCTWKEAEMVRLLDQLLALLRSDGVQGLIDQAAPLLEPEQRQTAFAVATNLTLADHVESSEEQHFLRELAAVLQISADRTEQILAVISLLNRDSLAS